MNFWQMQHFYCFILQLVDKGDTLNTEWHVENKSKGESHKHEYIIE